MRHGRELMGYGVAPLAHLIGTNVQAWLVPPKYRLIIWPIRCAGGQAADDNRKERWLMKDLDFLKELIRRGDRAEDGYFEFAHLVAVMIPKALIEQLEQLVNGPVEDGDVISKSLRGELFELGLAVRVCCKGDQGYTGATYFAYCVLKRFHEIRKGEVGA